MKNLFRVLVNKWTELNDIDIFFWICWIDWVVVIVFNSDFPQTAALINY